MSDQSKCEEYAELLDAYHDGELADSERVQVEQHLSSCADCKKKVESIAALVNVLGNLGKVSMPRDIVASMNFDFMVPASSDQLIRKGTHGGELIDAYHDGELSADENLAIERHISACSDCATKLNNIQDLVRGVKNLEQALPARDIVGSMQFDCGPILELLDAYHDGELEAADKQRVDEHLKACAMCNDNLVAISQVVSGLRALPQLALSRDLVATMDFSSSPQSAPVVPPAAPSLLPGRSNDTTATLVSNSSNVLPLKKNGLRKNAWVGFGAVAAAAAALIFAVNVRPIAVKDMASNPKSNPSTVSTQVANSNKFEPGQEESIAYSSKAPDSTGINKFETNAPESTDIRNSASYKIAHGESNSIIPEGNNAAVVNLNPAANNSNATNIDSKSSSKDGAINTDRTAANRYDLASRVDVPGEVHDLEIENSQAVTLNVASLETNTGVADALGIATDEDGLYDIKI